MLPFTFAFEAYAGGSWSDALREDVEAMVATVRADHPGPVNDSDPGFTERMEAARATALERADKVRSHGAYRSALSAFVASFDDPHVFIEVGESDPRVRWPGFIAAPQRGSNMVVVAGSADLPLGTVIEACDGSPVRALLGSNVAPFVGRWRLLATRLREGWRLFVDTGNPWTRRPEVCEIREGDSTRSVRLRWDRAPDDLGDRIWLAGPPRAGIGVEPGQDLYWVSLGTFASSGPAATQLGELTKALADDVESLRAAQRIVLDVRGNRGGWSEWGVHTAVAIWGKPAVDRAVAELDREISVQWRVSDANLDHVRAINQRAHDRAGPGSMVWSDQWVAGIEASLRDGAALWTEPPHLATMPSPATPETGVTVFVVTDAACASSCLAALDLWTRLGAIPVGWETDADGRYNEIRTVDLPSGLATFSFPIKVKQGLARVDRPVVPAVAFEGEPPGAEALRVWVRSLPLRAP